MKRLLLIAIFVSISTLPSLAQDWPQWRGANRDAAAVFQAPQRWPEELAQKWKVTVGEGVATPALVGDRLYVFSRQDGFEVTRCLAASDGKEIWQEKYEALGISGPAQSFSGPRSSPAVAEGKVVTIGVRGMISALNAGTGEKLWRKDEFHSYPTFYQASSPLMVDGMVIAQLGGPDNGAVVAYDLASGNEKWKWSGPSPAYASPAPITVGGTKLILARTAAKLVALKAADGTLAWESPAEGGGGGRGGGGRGGRGGGDYRAASPVVAGDTFYIAGRGFKAMKLDKSGDTITARELWSNPEKSVLFNTPVLKEGKLYALATNDELFCIDAISGKTLWAAPFPSPAGGGAAAQGAFDWRSAPVPGVAAQVFAQAAPGERGRPGGPGRGGGRRGGMGARPGFGSLVDAGSVLMALTPAGRLVVLEPSVAELKQVKIYKVTDGQTHAYPVASGNRIFIKDNNSVMLYTVE